MTPEALADLHGRCFDRGWPADAFSRYLDDPSCLVVHRPEGFALARLVLDEAELLTIATDPAHRQKGVARSLLAELLALVINRDGKVIFLEVATDNVAARALYGRSGFVEVGRRDGYYPRAKGPAADALTLRKALP